MGPPESPEQVATLSVVMQKELDVSQWLSFLTHQSIFWQFWVW